MSSSWTLVTFIGLISRLEVGMSSAVHVQRVELGSKVTLSCNISYAHQTTWFRHNAGRPPTMVLCASLSGGQAVQVFQLRPRYTITLAHHSLDLNIEDVDRGDLGLYYCTTLEKTCVTVGGGVALEGPPVESSRFHFHMWHCVAVGSALLVMASAVCLVHCHFHRRRRRRRKTKTHHCCQNLQRKSTRTIK